MDGYLAGVLLCLSLGAAAQGSGLLGEPFENERLHVRLRPPAGWRLANAGLTGEEPIEFWKQDEYGPRIQVHSFPYRLSDPSSLDGVQRELSAALREQFPTLQVVDERQLTHQGHPAIEVTANLEAGDTYYHVIQRCLFARGRVFIITCASFESSFLSELPLFRACLESVEVLGDIFNSGTGGASALISPARLGLLALGVVVSGILVRRLSAWRLKKLGNWPLRADSP